MSRLTMDIYAFGTSPDLARERDELVAELTALAEAKLKAGIRPVPLQRALLDVADLIGGHSEAGQDFIERVRRAV